MKHFFFVIIITVVLGMPVNAQDLHHMVLVWLKPSISGSEIEVIISETKKLSDIKGIQSFKVGRAIESDRTIVDDSFTFGISMTFEDKEKMTQYLVDKRHVTYVETVLKPALNKVVVYDF